MKIAIASGKGGTGKTTLSTNLSAYLSMNDKLVLADLDVEEPNSLLFLKGELVHEEIKYQHIPEWHEETCSLCDNCHEVCKFNAVIRLGQQIMVFPQLCHSCYACSELCPTASLPMKPHQIGMLRRYRVGDVIFIESRLDIGQEQAVPLIAQTINYIDQHFGDMDIIIYDSPPGTSCPVIEVAKDCDFVILVTEPTPFGFHDLKIAVETIRKLDKDFGVVINRYGIGNDDVSRFCDKENIPVLAKIPNSRAVAELYARGQLVYNQVPEVQREIARVARFIRSLVQTKVS